jgi:hypothetical protein
MTKRREEEERKNVIMRQSDNVIMANEIMR